MVFGDIYLCYQVRRASNLQRNMNSFEAEFVFGWNYINTYVRK